MGSVAIDPGALDPNTGQTVSQTDPAHYNVLSVYYRLLAIYQREADGAADRYLNRVWHDYAVLLIQTAQFMGIRTRPPGFKLPDTPPSIHKIALTKDYQLKIDLVPACNIPPDPDPATDTLQAIPLSRPGADQEYRIVKASPSINVSVGAGLSKDFLISALKALTPELRMEIITAALSA